MAARNFKGCHQKIKPVNLGYYPNRGPQQVSATNIQVHTGNYFKNTCIIIIHKTIQQV